MEIFQVYLNVLDEKDVFSPVQTRRFFPVQEVDEGREIPPDGDS